MYSQRVHCFKGKHTREQYAKLHPHFHKCSLLVDAECEAAFQDLPAIANNEAKSLHGHQNLARRGGEDRASIELKVRSGRLDIIRSARGEQSEGMPVQVEQVILGNQVLYIFSQEASNFYPQKEQMLLDRVRCAELTELIQT